MVPSRTRRRIRVCRLPTATVAGGVHEVGIDRLGNGCVGAQGSARGSGSGAVVDHRLDGVDGICAGGCLGLMAGPAYRAFGRLCRSRCNRFGRGRPSGAERNPCCRGRYTNGGASTDRRQATGIRRFAAREQRPPAARAQCSPARVVAVRSTPPRHLVGYAF